MVTVFVQQFKPSRGIRKAYGDRALLHEQMGRKDLAAADWARMRSLR